MLFAALDIGTNSVRMGVVDTKPDGTWSTVASHKEVVRLGEGEFGHEHMRLSPEAMGRAVRVLSRFAEMARGYGAVETVALATAASREAENQNEFVEAVREASDGFLDVRVISGHEEARLIYLGVRSGIYLPPTEKALFMDIGGGSTELIVGDAQKHLFLDSLKLGAIRMTGLHLQGQSGPVPALTWAKMRQQVRSTLAPAARSILQLGFTRMYGSSGTIMSLAEATARRLHSTGAAPSSMRNYELQLAELDVTIEWLMKMTVEERRKVAGLTPERADIVMGGAVILQTVMETVGAESIFISDRGLREGIVVDHLMREDGLAAKFEDESVRLRSVTALGRKCGIDEVHAKHIEKLALSLFDQTSALGLHDLSSSRELLEYASLLHDCGFFVSHTNHHQHSYYLIRNSELLGFNDIEVEIMAQIAYYHRKAPPRRKHLHFASLTENQQHAVRVLSCCLRLAEALDRGHLATMRGVTLKQTRPEGPVTMVFDATPEADSSLEVWAVEAHLEVFQKAFGVPLTIERPKTAVARS